MLRPLLGSTPHASFVLMEDRALMQDQFQLWNNISTGPQEKLRPDHGRCSLSLRKVLSACSSYDCAQASLQTGRRRRV